MDDDRLARCSVGLGRRTGLGERSGHDLGTKVAEVDPSVPEGGKHLAKVSGGKRSRSLKVPNLKRVKVAMFLAVGQGPAVGGES